MRLDARSTGQDKMGREYLPVIMMMTPAIITTVAHRSSCLLYSRFSPLPPLSLSLFNRSRATHPSLATPFSDPFPSSSGQAYWRGFAATFQGKNIEPVRTPTLAHSHTPCHPSPNHHSFSHPFSLSLFTPLSEITRLELRNHRRNFLKFIYD